MTAAPETLLVAAVVGVGILHTIVPDHWVPITLIARQHGWSRGETAAAALKAGTGHVLSTLVIGLVVWFAGVAFATTFGTYASVASSLALIGFGAWIAIVSLRELRWGHAHGHGHDDAHGGEQFVRTPSGTISLSIFERDTPPRFRVVGSDLGTMSVETVRGNGDRQRFALRNFGPYWESDEAIPEPHAFEAVLQITRSGHSETYRARFDEHDEAAHRGDHEAVDALHKPLGGATVAVAHAHAHRHGNGKPHLHRHDHDTASWHLVETDANAEPPLHEHVHKTSPRTALLLILGSSPMVEGIPAFFAAGKYGPGLIAIMTVAFGISTIATYVTLCVSSTIGLQRLTFGSFEKYGEVVSGAFIALIGLVFLFVPVL